MCITIILSNLKDWLTYDHFICLQIIRSVRFSILGVLYFRKSITSINRNAYILYISNVLPNTLVFKKKKKKCDIILVKYIFSRTKLNVYIQGQLVFTCYFILFEVSTHTFTNKISSTLLLKHLKWRVFWVDFV